MCADSLYKLLVESHDPQSRCSFLSVFVSLCKCNHTRTSREVCLVGGVKSLRVSGADNEGGDVYEYEENTPCAGDEWR